MSKEQRIQGYVGDIRRGSHKACGVEYETLSGYPEYNVASVGLDIRALSVTLRVLLGMIFEILTLFRYQFAKL